MIIKFTAQTMNGYKGQNGMGKLLNFSKKDETSEVSDIVGKLLCQKYGRNFEEVKEVKAHEEPSQSDKKQRKVASFRTK